MERHPLFKENWLPSTTKMINEEITKVFVNIQRQMKREIVPAIAVGATGDLKKSYRALPITGRGIEIEGIWGTEVDYAPYHEYGTGPHFPPVAPLIPWVIAKGTFEDAKGTPISDSSPEYIVKGMAFLVARAISRRGTTPGNEVENWFQKNEVRITRLIIDKLSVIFRKATEKESGQ
jgi:hypothetical protein